MKTSFNFSRYMLLLRHDLAENKQSYRIYLLATLIASWGVMALNILFSVLSYYTSLADESEWARSRALDNIGLGWGIDMLMQSMVLVVLMGVAQTTLFSCYNTRIKRMRYLIVPGSQLEKFLSRFTITNILGVFIPLVAVGVAFVLHGLVAISFDVLILDQALTRVYEILIKVFHDENFVLTLVTLISMSIFNTSVNIFASAIFRSYAYIKLMVVQYVLTIPFVVFLPFLEGFVRDVINLIELYTSAFLWTSNLIVLCLSALLIWVSYHLFKRTDLTGYKLFRR